MKRKTTEQFISEARVVHGDKYNYDLVEYTTRNKKVKIICSLHGVFEQQPYVHLSGSGCYDCGKKLISVGRVLTTDEFIKRSKEKHGDIYDYSLTEYKNCSTKVKIIYPVHGVFEQRPHSHMNGLGCSRCNGGVLMIFDDFIKRSKEEHGDKYDYSLVEYVDMKTKIKIICLKHGIFEQRPAPHIYKSQGCPECAFFDRTKTTEKFIIEANIVHNNQYDYSMVEYNKSHEKIKIICPIHGMFEQRPYAHTQGAGCPSCKNTISKQEISFRDFIKEIYQDEIITNSRKVINPYELDIYLPNRRLAFEYNGDFWHEEGIKVPIGYHQMKTDMCSNKGIRLTHIWGSDWKRNKSYIKDMVRELICH